MPKDGDPLPAGQIALIRSWIDQGAAWPDTGDSGGRPPRRATGRAAALGLSPAGASGAARRAPAGMGADADRSLRPGPAREGRADAVARGDARNARAPRLARSDRVAAFAAGSGRRSRADAARDGKDAAYLRLVDRLLASPHYGERWARPWLDLARYADSQGFEKDLPRVMWKYRDWVIDALNRDMPFDRFTIEQIAGDMLPECHAGPAHRQRVPSQRDDERGRRASIRTRRSTKCSSIASTRPPRPGSAPRSAARSATTTSTTPSRRRTTSGCWRSSRTATTRCARPATARGTSNRRSICRRPSRKRRGRRSRPRSIG